MKDSSEFYIVDAVCGHVGRENKGVKKTMNCRELISLASNMIDNRDSAEKILKVLESIRDRLWYGVDRIGSDDYYWFCYQYGYYCLEFGKLKAADYYLRRTIDMALDRKDFERVSDTVAFLLYVMHREHLIAEAIQIGERYDAICSGSVSVDGIRVGLCYLYATRGWNRKAQKTAEKVLCNSEKRDRGYPSFLYKCLNYNKNSREMEKSK